MAVAISIRRATEDDAEFVVWTILAAMRGNRPRGYFNIALDWPEPRVASFLKTIATHRLISWWHVSTFWIAEVDGVPAAALCAFPARGGLEAAGKVVRQALCDAGVSDDERDAINARGAYVRTCLMPGGDANWMIEHVAVKPEHRGRGLVQLLMAHALAEGAAVGFRRASIMFYIGNEPAERCYAKSGFTFAEECRDPTFEATTGAAGFRRFEREI